MSPAPKYVRRSCGRAPAAFAAALCAPAAFAAAWLALALGGGCRPAALPAPPPERPWSLVASGDTDGWIAPCGCTAKQSGGLARRATYIDKLRAGQEVIVVDVGGAAGGVSPYDEAKLAAILRGEVAMGIVAHNIGRSEAALGAERLRRLESETKAPLVSANLRDRSGQPLFPPLRMAQAGACRVAIVGVVSPRMAGPGLRAEEPAAAVLQALSALAKHDDGAARPRDCGYDVAVVLAYLPSDELDLLARALPEVDIVVGGPTLQPISPRPVGPTLLASVTGKGKFLAHFTCAVAGGERSSGERSGGERSSGERSSGERSNGANASSLAVGGPGHASRAWQGEIVEMNDSLADQAVQVANLATFRAELEKRDIAAAETSFAPSLPERVPSDYRIAGSASCAACHAEDHRVWNASTHSTAWQTLVKTGAQVDSDCQRCHTTGFGLPGGFVSAARSPERTSVGCESCHGPSQAHVAESKTPTTFAARDQCLRCHDRENSPEFAFDGYWKQIEHGQIEHGPGEPTSVSRAPATPGETPGQEELR